MTNSKKKVLLISLDALGTVDLPVLQKQPHFARILQEGAYCTKEESIFPSLTFPAHSSIATGCKAAHHGIVNNYLFEPFSETDHWNFYATNLRRPALWDYAAEAGKKVMSLSWPVSAGANIEYSMPEMTPAKPKIWTPEMYDEQMKVLETYGTPQLAKDLMQQNPALARAWFLGEQPLLDEEMTSLVLDCLQRYPCDIMMFHVYGMDVAKHTYGVASEEAHEFLPLYDAFIEKLMQYVDEEMKQGTEVTLMITGDHSQKNVDKAVYVNHLMQDMGLCEWRDGKLQSWRALVDSGDGMAYLYVQSEENAPEIARQVADRFSQHPGVANIFWPEELEELGCDSSATLVLEAADGYGFEDHWYSGEDIDENAVAPNGYRAIHGYLPDAPGYQTMFLAYGPAVQHTEIDNMSILDITPTICNWMELPGQEMDGRVVKEIFGKD